MIAKLAFRELVGRSRFSLLFVLNLALGLYGFVALDAFKASIQRSLSTNARQLLTADLSISSRRPLSDGENETIRRVLGSRVDETQVVTLYTMVSSAHGSRLAEVTAVENSYPFYGHLTLNPGGTIVGSSAKDIVQSASVWLSPELAQPLQLGIGDTVRIGNRPFRTSSLVTEDTAHGSRLFDLAPRLYVGRQSLESTHLLQRGSVIEYDELFRLRADQNSEAIAHALDRQLTDSGVEVQTARQSSASLSRLQGFLDDYLGLVALVALFLAVLGSAYLFRSFLIQRLKEMAILISLGLPARRARSIHLVQLSILGAAAAILASGLAALTLPWTIRTVGSLLLFPVEPVLRLQSVAMALGIGVVGSIFSCLPFLNQLKNLPPVMLFHDSAADTLSGSWTSALISAVPALVLCWILSVWQAHSWTVGGFFFAGVLLSAGSFSLLAAAALMWWLPLWTVRDWSLRLALRNLVQHRLASISVFTAMGLGTVLISVIPQIQKSISQDIEKPNVSTVASLFLFDIQEEELDPLTRWATDRGVTMGSITPLIRGRLISINGKAYEKNVDPEGDQTREEERDRRSRNRGFNLTYRAQRLESETLVSGRDFSGVYTPDVANGPPAELSVEVRFAQRLRMKLGDLLEFDIQGIPVKGKIVNFRKVNWSSFQPNFFIQFQPGVLEGAPKTYLASVSGMNRTARVAFQDAVNRQFPNISMIDISALVQKILEIFTQMGRALRLMAILSVLAGLAVLFSIAQHQAALRQSESNLLKVLGASFGRIQRVFGWEFGGLALIASMLGTLLSFGVSAILSSVMFDHIGVFSWKAPVAIMIAVPLLSLFTVRLATRRTLSQPPMALLQNEN